MGYWLSIYNYIFLLFYIFNIDEKPVYLGPIYDEKPKKNETEYKSPNSCEEDEISASSSSITDGTELEFKLLFSKKWIKLKALIILISLSVVLRYNLDIHQQKFVKSSS